jgi:hypothetical protein
MKPHEPKNRYKTRMTKKGDKKSNRKKRKDNKTPSKKK